MRLIDAFIKVRIKKGQTKLVTLELDERNFSYWDINSKNWKLKEGEYEILIGSSSENIHLREKLSLK